MIVSEVVYKKASNGTDFVKVITDKGTYNAFDVNVLNKVKELNVKAGDEVKIDFVVNGKYKNMSNIEVLSSGNEVEEKNSSEDYWREKHELDKKRFLVDSASKKWFLFSNCFNSALEFFKLEASVSEGSPSEEDVFKLAEKIFEKASGKALVVVGDEKDVKECL